MFLCIDDNIPDCYNIYAVIKLIKLLLVLKLPGYTPGPCSMGKLTVFSKRFFFCHSFDITNHRYSIFLVFALHLVVAQSELIGVDYSDNCGSKSTINFDAHLGGRVSFRHCYTIFVTARGFFSTMFASLIIYTILWDGKWGVWGAKPPRR